jgi:hypothetical protein
MPALKQNVVTDKYKEDRGIEIILARFLSAQDKVSVHRDSQDRPKDATNTSKEARTMGKNSVIAGKLNVNCWW